MYSEMLVLIVVFLSLSFYRLVYCSSLFPSSQDIAQQMFISPSSCHEYPTNSQVNAIKANPICIFSST